MELKTGEKAKCKMKNYKTMSHEGHDHSKTTACLAADLSLLLQLRGGCTTTWCPEFLEVDQEAPS